MLEEASKEVRSRPKYLRRLAEIGKQEVKPKPKEKSYPVPEWADDLQWLLGVGRYGQ